MTMNPTISLAGGTLLLLATVTGAVLGTAPSLATAQTPHYERLPILDRDWTSLDAATVDGELQRQREVGRRWHQVHDMIGAGHVSRRSARYLRARGLGSGLLEKSAPVAVAATPEDPDTLSILIIRLGYETNREPDLNTIVPAGGFEMAALPAREDTLYVDPPPHGRAYFESHLNGLKQFYEYQSGGRLHIEGTVLPREEDRWYTLSDIADFGPGKRGAWNTDEILETPGNIERYIRAVMVAADEGTQADHASDPSVPLLADYDDDNDLTYIIFVHAGSDWQSDVNGDSPNDLPTFFITLGEPQDLTSIDSITNEPGALSECSLIPETTNQDGWAGSIAAALYHEFGHSLGLPDVYATDNGLPSVGIWDLMDSGTNLPVPLGFINAQGDTIRSVATGVLPPSLGAWNKWFLGWLRMGEVTSEDTDMRLPAVQVPADQYQLYRTVNRGFQEKYPQAVAGGLSPRDWFLLENRWVPTGADEMPYNQIALERVEATGVITHLAGERLGNWFNTGMYDYFLPAGGMLCWHVNNDRIARGLPSNEINIDGDGLRLVEADGIQDIGVVNAYVIGWYGSALDPFGGREGDTGFYNGFNDLYTEGMPHSRCYDRSWSGLSLSEVRNEGHNPAVLRFSATVDGALRKFPWTAPPIDTTRVTAPPGAVLQRSLSGRTLTPVEVDDPLAGGEPRSVLVFADTAPDGWDAASWRTGLHSLRQNGTARWINGAFIDEAGRPTAQFAELDGPLTGSPAAWSEADGSGRLLVGDGAGVVSLWSLPTAGLPASLWSRDTGEPVRLAPTVLADEDGVLRATLWAGGTDRIDAATLADGAPTGPWLELSNEGLGPVTGFADALRPVPGNTPWDDVLVATDAGWFRVGVSDGGLTVAQATAWPVAPEGMIRTAVVDDVYAVWDDRGLLGCWSMAGTPLEGLYPAEAPLVAEPAVADLDGDGANDVILATATRILAWRGDGSAVRGYPKPLFDLFPLADSTRVAGPVVVADSDGDGANEVIFATDGGHLFQLGPTGERLDGYPFRFGDRATAGLAVAPGDDPVGDRVLWLLSGGGYAEESMPARPVPGRLTAFRMAPVAALHTSEWQGPSGTADRRGPAGPATHLAAAAPVMAEAGNPVIYPNPLRSDDLTVRFFSSGGAAADFMILDLEGEVVLRQRIEVTAGTINEQIIRLPGLVSGLYVCRLRWDDTAGRQTRTMTLAIEK